MNYNKFFELAKQAGIEEAEIFISTSYSLSFSLFHGEIEKYSVEESTNYDARGIINGKLGSVHSNIYNNETAEYFVKEILANASVIETDDPVFLFKGSEKYKKVSTFNKDLGTIPVDEKIAKLYEIEKKIKEADERIVEVEGVEYAESSSSITLINSYGLKLTQKSNDFQYVAAAVAKQGEQVKTGYDYIFGNDFSKFNVDELVEKVVKSTVEQLGGEPCKSKGYKAILSQEVVSSLLRAYIGNANAEKVQKKSSLFIDKVGQQIASKKLTVEDTPLAKTVFARWFDDEGVATYNKAIIKNGVLQTYLHNLSTATKAGTTTTANGFGSGKVGIAPTYLKVKPGKLSLDQLFEKVGNGIYITSVAGIHAGLNPQSGNFSLQANGFLVENGKKTTPVDLITIGGNLLELFNNIAVVGGDTKELIGMSTPSLVIKKIKVSGK